MTTEITTSEQTAFLAHLREAGAVVHTLTMRCDDTAGIAAKCRVCLLAAMDALAAKYKVEIPAVAGRHPVSSPISFADMLGPACNLEKEQLTLYCYQPDVEIKSTLHATGLAYALLDPPYSLRFERTGEFASKEYELSETTFYTNLLKDYLRIMLHAGNATDIQHLSVFSWTTDWSTFFDCGRQWWGTFCWTVHDARTGDVVVIMAASTD